MLQILLNYPPYCSEPVAPNWASLDLARQNDSPGLLLWGDHRSLYLSVAKLNDVAIRCSPFGEWPAEREAAETRTTTLGRTGRIYSRRVKFEREQFLDIYPIFLRNILKYLYDFKYMFEDVCDIDTYTQLNYFKIFFLQ